MGNNTTEKIAALQTGIAKDQTALKGLHDKQEKELGKMQEELGFLRSIIGDFHPSASSKTYRELYEESLRLKKAAAEQSKQQSLLEKRLNALEKESKEKEQEITELRREHFSVPTAIKEKKKPFFFLRKKEKKKDLSEEEKRRFFSQMLFHPSFHFSDAQTAFLALLATKEERLPADALLQLLDGRLSCDKMKKLYSVLCHQYHVEPVDYQRELMKLQGKEPEKEAAPQPIKNDIIPFSIDEGPDEEANGERVRKLMTRMLTQNDKIRRR